MCLRATFTILTVLLFTACSSDSNDDKENILDKTTHEIAEKAVATIQDPLDKARSAVITVEEHNREVQKQVQDQSEGK
jgi:hypothetical protein